jgi:hypothetical protein
VVDGELVGIDVPESVVEALPSWDLLPEDWKQRYGLHRDVGKLEYARHVEREASSRRRAGVSRRVSPSPSCRHPALEGP